MDLSELTAISPIDGRYRSKLASLATYFSEYGLIRYRLRIEVEYLIALIAALNVHDSASFSALAALDLVGLRSLYSEEKFTPEEAQKVKNHEKVTNHDVKAVEYYLKDHITTLVETDKTWELVKEYIHFGLTSQDINNLSIPLLLKVRPNSQLPLPFLLFLTRSLLVPRTLWMSINVLSTELSRISLL